jgi:para-nitrobenzyl esterase
MKSFLACLILAAWTPAAARPTVTSDKGVLAGIERDGVRVFLGVPYAAPPTRELRWQPPQPMHAWRGVREASHVSRVCVQTDDVRPQQSEDCLYANVWAPRTTEKLPVLVWIHGGAFAMGAGSDEDYDGQKLANAAHAVVVTFNYRVGALGFMAHPALARALGREVMPSLGILDQRAALAWVQRNIGAFGGDSARVTIFGESAGAWSVCVHLAAPKSRGLFARAIMQSGACSDALYFTPEKANAQGEMVARAVGCDGTDVVACLHRVPAKTIARVLPFKRGLILHPGVWWGPIVDGVELPRLPLQMITAGDFARVPLMIGANADEGAIHVAPFATLTRDDVIDFVRDSFGEAAIAPVLARYQRPTPKQALNDIIGDGIFVCQARRVARAFAQAGVPAYLYHFTRALDDARVHHLGATHSIELWFMFGNHAGDIRLSEAEEPLSRLMMQAWGAFARDGDPATSELRWPRYTTAADAHLTLDLSPSIGTGLDRENCDFWDQR